MSNENTSSSQKNEAKQTMEQIELGLTFQDLDDILDGTGMDEMNGEGKSRGRPRAKPSSRSFSMMTYDILFKIHERRGFWTGTHLSFRNHLLRFSNIFDTLTIDPSSEHNTYLAFLAHFTQSSSHICFEQLDFNHLFRFADGKVHSFDMDRFYVDVVAMSDVMPFVFGGFSGDNKDTFCSFDRDMRINKRVVDVPGITCDTFVPSMYTLGQFNHIITKSMTRHHPNPWIHLLSKCIPQPCKRRLFASVTLGKFTDDTMIFVNVVNIMAASILGNDPLSTPSALVPEAILSDNLPQDSPLINMNRVQRMVLFRREIIQLLSPVYVDGRLPVNNFMLCFIWVADLCVLWMLREFMSFRIKRMDGMRTFSQRLYDVDKFVHYTTQTCKAVRDKFMELVVPIFIKEGTLSGIVRECEEWAVSVDKIRNFNKKVCSNLFGSKYWERNELMERIRSFKPKRGPGKKKSYKVVVNKSSPKIIQIMRSWLDVTLTHKNDFSDNSFRNRPSSFCLDTSRRRKLFHAVIEESVKRYAPEKKDSHGIPIGWTMDGITIEHFNILANLVVCMIHTAREKKESVFELTRKFINLLPHFGAPPTAVKWLMELLIAKHYHQGSGKKFGRMFITVQKHYPYTCCIFHVFTRLYALFCSLTISRLPQDVFDRQCKAVAINREEEDDAKERSMSLLSGSVSAKEKKANQKKTNDIMRYSEGSAPGDEDKWYIPHERCSLSMCPVCRRVSTIVSDERTTRSDRYSGFRKIQIDPLRRDLYCKLSREHKRGDQMCSSTKIQHISILGQLVQLQKSRSTICPNQYCGMPFTFTTLSSSGGKLQCRSCHLKEEAEKRNERVKAASESLGMRACVICASTGTHNPLRMYSIGIYVCHAHHSDLLVDLIQEDIPGLILDAEGDFNEFRLRLVEQITSRRQLSIRYKKRKNRDKRVSNAKKTKHSTRAYFRAMNRR